ncbi:hypothetical protein BH10PSE18_BH10PSE18_44720 [soil metagenome]
MTPFLKTCALTLAAAAVLTACGGGNDDDPTPSDRTGVLTVTASTVDGLNGVYGDGNVNLTDVDKKNPVGSDPEVCTFKFDGLNKVAGTTTAFGDVRYQPNATSLYLLFITVGGKEFSSGDGADTGVVRTSDRVQLSNKLLTASDGTGATVRVSGLIPMRPSRPTGC